MFPQKTLSSKQDEFKDFFSCFCVLIDAKKLREGVCDRDDFTPHVPYKDGSASVQWGFEMHPMR